MWRSRCDNGHIALRADVSLQAFRLASPTLTNQKWQLLPRSRAHTAAGLRISGADATLRHTTAATPSDPSLQTTGNLSLAEEHALLDAAVEDDAAGDAVGGELASLERRASTVLDMVTQHAPDRALDDSDRVLALVLLKTGLSDAQAASQISTLPSDAAVRQLMINQLVAV